jgi:hypothetical protein
MTDSTPAVLTELAAARALLIPQIRGLQDLATPGTPADLAATLGMVTDAKIERLILIEAVMAAIAALQANDYPLAHPVAVLPSSQLAELQEERSAVAAAAALFTAPTIGG